MSFDSSGSGGDWSPVSRSRGSPDVSMGFRDLALNCATELRESRRHVSRLERTLRESQRNHRRDMIESAKRFQEMRYEYDDILQQEMDEIEQSRIHRNDVLIHDGALTRLANRRIQDREKRKFQDKIAELTKMCTYSIVSYIHFYHTPNHLYHTHTQCPKRRSDTKTLNPI